MTNSEENYRFRHLYYFVIGLCLFGAILSIFIVWTTRDHIDMILTFWLSSAVNGGIGYLIGSSANKSNTTTPKVTENIVGGTTDVSLSLTASNQPPAEPELTEEGKEKDKKKP